MCGSSSMGSKWSEPSCAASACPFPWWLRPRTPANRWPPSTGRGPAPCPSARVGLRRRAVGHQPGRAQAPCPSPQTRAPTLPPPTRRGYDDRARWAQLNSYDLPVKPILPSPSPLHLPPEPESPEALSLKLSFELPPIPAPPSPIPLELPPRPSPPWPIPFKLPPRPPPPSPEPLPRLTAPPP